MIQYLRAVAAVAVVLHHARNPQSWLYNPLANWEAGQSGVDIFFVISGFIMYSAASSETVASFAWRRFVRIVPLYWAATAMTFFSVTVHRISLKSALPHLLASISFIPHYSPERIGQIYPVLVPGWTLNYEVFFYAVFALGIALRRVIQTVAVTLCIFVCGGVFLKSDSAIWLTYTDPLLFEFLGGVALAKLQNYLNIRWIAWLSLVGAALLVLSSEVELPRLIKWGIPSLLVVTGALAFEKTCRVPKLPLLLMLGEASYSIYLFQGVALSLTSKAVQYLPRQSIWTFIGMVGGGLSLAIIMGVGIHLLFERRVLRILRKAPSIMRGDALAAP